MGARRVKVGVGEEVTLLRRCRRSGESSIETICEFLNLERNQS